MLEAAQGSARHPLKRRQYRRVKVKRCVKLRLSLANFANFERYVGLIGVTFDPIHW